MSVKELRDAMPDYAKDIKINLGKVLDPENSPLSKEQIAGLALASAYASKNTSVIEHIKEEATKILDETHLNAVKAATAIMGMNNIYYRFIHLNGDDAYGNMPVNLRMQIMQSHGISQVDFELFSLAVSAITGCGMCMKAHVINLVKKENISKDIVLESIRIASAVHAAAQVQAIENS